MSTTELPGSAEIDATVRLVEDHAQRIYTWNYERERPQLVTLYNKAMSSQWNSITELDWDTDVDPERLVLEMEEGVPELMRVAAEVDGSPIASWTDKEFARLGVEMLKARLSQFMHGEQGAMLTTAKIVETVPWIDAKYYAATQVMDEARHTEVFAKYIDTKIGEAYPMSPMLEAQIVALMEDSRWDISYLGMQIVLESLALAAFGDMLRSTTEPLLKKLLRYVMSDEARHVAFGVLSLTEFYNSLSAAELKERQEFLVENTLRQRARAAAPEVWERLGVPFEPMVAALMEAAGKMKEKGKGGNPYAGFQRGFYAKLVPNVRKLGLLDANDGWLRNKWAEAGLLEFEFADDTGTDYANYDAVAEDRAAAAAAKAE